MRTNAGRDWQAAIMGNGSHANRGTGAMAPASYIGLTENATSPSSSDTALTGEISSGALARAQATYAHTNGQATYTLSKTFTSDRTATINKIGVFTALSGGVMAFTETCTPASLVSGDQVSFTVTITL